MCLNESFFEAKDQFEYLLKQVKKTDCNLHENLPEKSLNLMESVCVSFSGEFGQATKFLKEKGFYIRKEESLDLTEFVLKLDSDDLEICLSLLKDKTSNESYERVKKMFGKFFSKRVNSYYEMQSEDHKKIEIFEDFCMNNFGKSFMESENCVPQFYNFPDWLRPKETQNLSYFDVMILLLSKMNFVFFFNILLNIP
eukprot:snap_masked-scaffold_23-processed-gene-2.38-mRNA-1 protein AED:1.00 eAED:1.00 QI:0/0/0/0/1/1/2/0/196